MIKLENSDNWIFLSVARSDGSELSNFFAAADHINCAIPTNEEIEGGINRLYSCNLVNVENNCFALTDEGRTLFNRVGGLEEYPHKQPMMINPLLIEIAETANSKPRWKLDPAVMDEAYNKYSKRISEISKEIKRKQNNL